MKYPYVMSPKTCTILIDGRPYQTDRTNANWGKIKEALADDATTADELILLMSPATAIAAAAEGHNTISVRNGKVYLDNAEINNVLTERILDIVSEGLELDPWVKFAENIYANPQSFAQEELYLFLENGNLPLTQDGCFIAYKVVRDNYTDCHSGTFSNTIGNVVSMPREQVDPNRHNTCSRGLHFCSREYLPSFYAQHGTRVVLVKINPKDVVSIPSDYNNTKGRTWRYEVVGEIPYEEAMNRNWKPVDVGYTNPETDETHQWGFDEDDEVPEDDEEIPELPRYATMIDPDYGVGVEAETEAETEAEETEVYVESVAAGKIDQAKFVKLQKQHGGTMSGMARALGISTGTVQAWKTKLFGKAHG